MPPLTAAERALLDRETVERTVLEYLHKERESYLAALEAVRSLLREYQNTKEGSRAIYSITTRSDYPGERGELKSVRSIVEKVIQRREEQLESGQQMKYGPNVMGDIVGVRVICAYPSDVTAVRQYIEMLIHKRKLTLKDPFDQKNEESGYRGLHVTVSVPGPNSRILCEIQISTILQEAWNYKVHPLIYKGRNIDKRDEQQTKFLSDLLDGIDGQTKVVKDTVVARNAAEEARRLALLRTYLVRIFNGDASLKTAEGRPEILKRIHPSSVDFRRLNPEDAMLVLRLFVRAKRAELLSPATRDQAARHIWEQAEAYAAKHDLLQMSAAFSLGLYLCRVFAIAAVCEEGGHYWEPLRGHAYRLRDYAGQSQGNLAVAYRYEGWINSCLGDAAAAVDLTERAIECAEAASLPDVVKGAQNNLAYFTAELLDRDARRSRRRLSSDESRTKAKRAAGCIETLVAHAEEDLQREPSSQMHRERLLQLRDTEGYLRIATATNPEEVDLGIAQCQQLLQKRNSLSADFRDVAVPYAEYHVRRGRERLFELGCQA
jgi:ppGpp synthetase/RelA/SpoT-type nucleotidyltranferase